MKTVLQIIQRACGILNLTKPQSAFTSQDAQAQQFVDLLQEVADDIARDYDWQLLAKTQSFLTTATEEQVGVIPSDFDRYLPDTMFDRTINRKMIGPIPPREYQEFKSYPVYGFVYPYFRIVGNNILLLPTPSAGNTVVFEYQSKNWARSIGNNEQPEFLADTDTPILPDHLYWRGLVYRWKQAQGFDYQAELASFEKNLKQELSRARWQSNISMLGLTAITYRDRGPGVPEGNFPGP